MSVLQNTQKGGSAEASIRGPVPAFDFLVDGFIVDAWALSIGNSKLLVLQVVVAATSACLRAGAMVDG